MADASASLPTRGHKQRERTRRRLIEAAIDVIGEQGEGFAINDVTDRAGVSNGTFYNYFDDRDALIGAVVPEALHSFIAVSDALVEHADPAVRFAAISVSALHQAERAPERLRVLLRLDAAQRAILDGTVLDHLRSDLEAGVAAGRFDVEVDSAVLDTIAGALLLAVHRIIDHDVRPDYLMQVVTLLLRTLGLDPSAAAGVVEDAIALAESL